MTPEIIIKLGKTTLMTGDEPLEMPDVQILGNREGLRYLAQELLRAAERKPSPASLANGDPDDHSHLATRNPPFNSRLCDAMEFRIGILTAENRDQVFKKYGIRES